MEAGTAIGRAILDRNLPAWCADVALEYESVRRNAQRAALARQLPSAGDLERTHGYDGSDGLDPAYVEWCEKAERRYAESRRALLMAGPLVMFAVETWVLENTAVADLLPDLALGLNALARLYGVDNAG